MVREGLMNTEECIKPAQNESYVIPAGYHCNNRCLFCYNLAGEAIRPQLSLDQMKAQMQEAIDQGYDTVELFGGECTIEPYFFELLETAKQLKVKVRLTTNGQMFSDKDFVERLRGYDIHACQFSFHSHEEPLHDYLTQSEGGYQRTVRGILNFKKCFPKVHLVSYTVITRHNYKQLYKIAHYLQKLFGVHEAFFSFLMRPAEDGQFADLSVSYESVRPYLRKAFSYLLQQGIQARFNKGPVCVLPEYHASYQGEQRRGEHSGYCKPPVCGSCPHDGLCVGFVEEYQEQFGFAGLNLGGLTQERLPCFFAGLDMNAFEELHQSITFDGGNNMVFHAEQDAGSLRDVCQKANIPLCSIHKTGELMDVWNDFNFTPEAVRQFLAEKRAVSYDDLLQSVCRQLRQDFHPEVREENVFLTAGSRPALYSLFLMFLKWNDKVVLRKNMWDGYRYGAELAGGKVLEVDSYDEILRASHSDIRLIVVNNPQLPSLRARLEEKDLRSLIGFCNDQGAYLVVDEIGNRLSPEPFSVLSMCDLAKDNIIVTQSFSKNYFLSQYRAGYVIARPGMIENLKRLIEFSQYQISPVAISAAYAVLNSSQEWQRERAAVAYERGFL